jgi:hypothetical protein
MSLETIVALMREPFFVAEHFPAPKFWIRGGNLGHVG